MRNPTLVALLSAAIALPASAAFNYSDSTGDLFDNGFGNLDIANVNVWHSDTTVYFEITTAAFSNWTKYAVFISTPGMGSTGFGSNPWGRPHNSDQPVGMYLGTWVDQSADNTQIWATSGSGWGQTGMSTATVNGNTVTISMQNLWGNGDSILFDVGTSGGGNDPFVDLLSRSDQSTSGWGSASNAGEYRSYSFGTVPAPGALALLGLAGLATRRRR